MDIRVGIERLHRQRTWTEHFFSLATERSGKSANTSVTVFESEDFSPRVALPSDIRFMNPLTNIMDPGLILVITLKQPPPSAGDVLDRISASIYGRASFSYLPLEEKGNFQYILNKELYTNIDIFLENLL